MLSPDTVLQERYVVVRHLGQGGMGSVYLANDTRFRNTVALKETRFASGELRQAFEREAHLLRRLKHHALPGVIDYFEERGAAYLVMDFVPGEDLALLLDEGGRGGGLPPAQVVAMGIEILGALEYLHGHTPPILHRDVKPQNLKMTPAGRVMLLDFGLAKGSPADLSRLTGGSSIAAYTPHYAALEQVQGTGTTPRSDLYSVGATLYHLATGMVPPDALRRAMANVARERDPLPSASDVNPAVSKALAGVLQHAMALNPADRFATAAEFRRALHAAALTDETTIQIGPPSGARRGDTVREPAPYSQPSQTRLEPRARSRRTGALRLALAAALGLAFVVAATGVLAWAALSDSEPDVFKRPPSTPAPKPNTPTSHMPTAPVALAGHTEHIFSIAWSANGRMVASASYDKTVKIWDADGHLLSTLVHPDAVYDIAWSQNGKQIASCGSGPLVRVWDVATGQIVRTLEGHKDYVLSLAWQPSSTLASAGADGTVRLWDGDHGCKLIGTLSGHTGIVDEVTWSPDRVTLASADVNGTIRLWDGRTGESRGILGPEMDGTSALAWSPDGRFLASGGKGEYISVWDISTSKCLRTFVDHQDGIAEISWNHDGKSIASTDKDGVVLLWDPETAKLLETVSPRTGGSRTVAWSPDGKTLAVPDSDKTIRLQRSEPSNT